MPSGPSGPSHSLGLTAKARERAQGVLVFPVEGLNEAAWERWLAYRKTHKPLKAESIQAARRQMAKLGDVQMDAVEHSIANGYTGLIPPKPNGAEHVTKKRIVAKTPEQLEAEGRS